MANLVIVTKLQIKKSDPPTRHFVIECCENNTCMIDNVKFEGNVLAIAKTHTEAVRILKSFAPSIDGIEAAKTALRAFCKNPEKRSILKNSSHFKIKTK